MKVIKLKSYKGTICYCMRTLSWKHDNIVACIVLFFLKSSLTENVLAGSRLEADLPSLRQPVPAQPNHAAPSAAARGWQGLARRGACDGAEGSHLSHLQHKIQAKTLKLLFETVKQSTLNIETLQ